MYMPPVKSQSTKVTNTPTAKERRRAITVYKKSKFQKKEIATAHGIEQFIGIDRRCGQERRQKDCIKSKRLDNRCTLDRRAKKLSITI